MHKPSLKTLLSVAAAMVCSVAFGSVPSSTAWVQYTLTTNPQTLTVPFVFQNTSDLLVLDSKSSPPVTLVQNSDYSVTGGAGSTGTISTIAGGSNAVAVGDVITISRKVPLTQTTSFVNGGPLTAAMIGASVDKLSMIAQQLNLLAQNSLQFQGDEQKSGVLALSQRKNAFLAFDNNGVPWFPATASIVGSVTNPLLAVNIAALRIIPVASLPNNTPCTVAGYTLAEDGGGGVYVWNNASTATDDGYTTIQPTGVATGRWLLLLTNDRVLTSVTALRAMPSGGIPNGLPIRLTGSATLQDGGGGVYVWSSSSTAADDGYNVIQPTGVGTGRWLLQAPIPRIVASIAALKAVPVTGAPNGASVTVTGYYAANDGGGGTYVWNSVSTTSDNGGTVIQATGVSTGRWLLQYSAPVNVRWFGAKGDGSTDDTPAMQSALNIGVSVFIPPGTYSVSQLALDGTCSVSGSDAKACILSARGTSPVIQITTTAEVRGGLVLSDLSITGKNAIQVNTPGTTATYAVLHPTFRNLKLTGTYTAAGDTYATTDCLDNTGTLLARNLTTASQLTPSTYRSLLQAFGCGIAANKIYDAVITNCDIQGFGIGEWLWSCDNNNTQTNRFRNCAISYCVEYNASISEGSQNLFTHNELLSNFRAGDIFLISSRFNKIADNYFETYSDAALHFLIWATLGDRYINNRFDDPYNAAGTASGLVPLIIAYPFNRAQFMQNYFNDFDVTHYGEVRMIPYAVTTNQEQRWFMSTNSGNWEITTDAQGTEPFIIPNVLSPHNVQGKMTGNLADISNIESGGFYTFYNSASSTMGGTITVTGVQSQRLVCTMCGKLAAGMPSLTYTIRHMRNGSLLQQQTFTSAQLTTSAYGFDVATMVLTNLPVPNDQITVEWVANQAYVSSFTVDFASASELRGWTDGGNPSANPYTDASLVPTNPGEEVINFGPSPVKIWLGISRTAAASSWVLLN